MNAIYGPEIAGLHHEEFGELAEGAASLIVSLLGEAGIEDGTVVDLCSGSGILARDVSDRGYNVVGIDISPSMVAIAAEVAPEATFVDDDILGITLPDAVAVTAIGECLSYALATADAGSLHRMLAKIAVALVDGGVLLFDVAVPGRSGPTGARTVTRVGDAWALTLDAVEDVDAMTETRSILLLTQGAEGVWAKTEETHVLRLIAPDDVEAALADAGLSFERLDAYEGVALLDGVVGYAARKTP